jgi:type VI protein secretion system component Hcp
VQKREHSYTAGGNRNWSNSYGKQSEVSLKKLKIELPYDTAIPLLSKYLKKIKIQIRKDTFTPMFTAALFIIAKTWKRPKCPSADEE